MKLLKKFIFCLIAFTESTQRDQKMHRNFVLTRVLTVVTKYLHQVPYRNIIQKKMKTKYL